MVITLTEASKRSGVDRRWLRKQVERGLGEKVDGVWMVDEDQLSRLKLRYLRGRRLQFQRNRGMIRDGVTYYNDGSVG